MAVVVVGELLRELVGVLGEVSRLRCGDALVENLRKTACAQPERPDVLILFAGKEGGENGSLRG